MKSRLAAGLLSVGLVAAMFPGVALAASPTYLLEGACWNDSDPDPQLHQPLLFFAAGTMPEVRQMLAELEVICAEGTLYKGNYAGTGQGYSITRL